jgi:hypothetical protein
MGDRENGPYMQPQNPFFRKVLVEKNQIAIFQFKAKITYVTCYCIALLSFQSLDWISTCMFLIHEIRTSSYSFSASLQPFHFPLGFHGCWAFAILYHQFIYGVLCFFRTRLFPVSASLLPGLNRFLSAVTHAKHLLNDSACSDASQQFKCNYHELI